MAFPAILYTFASTPNAIKATGTPNTPIVIMCNNVALSTAILKNFHDKGFEDFVSYLATCLLRYALAGIVDPFLPQQVCDFYNTSTYYDTGLIIGTIEDGEHTISMTMTDV